MQYDVSTKLFAGLANIGDKIFDSKGTIVAIYSQHLLTNCLAPGTILSTQH